MSLLAAFLQSADFLLMAGMFLAVGALELAAPANPIPRRHYAFNASYAVSELLAAFLLGPTAAAMSAWAFQRLGFGRFDLRGLGFGGLGGAVSAVAASAFVHDLLFYWFHRLEHASPVLWQAHVLHHSDEHLNVTSGERSHFLEVFLIPLFVTIPMGVLFSLPPVEAGLLALVPYGWTYLVHANLKVGFGPLWWLAVSPAYHRIHHSLEERHRGRNYANWFPALDILFGTAWRPRPGEWPATGDAEVRVETLTGAYLGAFRAWGRMIK